MLVDDAAADAEAEAAAALLGREEGLAEARHDVGPGMAPEVVARLGEPFFTTKERGSGLGLGITRRIVHEQGGTLEVRSKPGEGTEVVVRLPPLGGP